MRLTTKQIQFLESLIDTYEDFPGKGISFKELSLLYTDVSGRKIIQDYFNSNLKALKPDCVIGCDARGFIVGMMIANEMGLPFVLARKPGKLPGDLLKKSYDLEYGKNELQMHRHIIAQYKAPIIADDVLATGGTVIAVTEMLKEIGIKVCAYAFISEIEALNARGRMNRELGITKQQILSIIKV